MLKILKEFSFKLSAFSVLLFQECSDGFLRILWQYSENRKRKWFFVSFSCTFPLKGEEPAISWSVSGRLPEEDHLKKKTEEQEEEEGRRRRKKKKTEEVEEKNNNNKKEGRGSFKILLDIVRVFLKYSQCFV